MKHYDLKEIGSELSYSELEMMRHCAEDNVNSQYELSSYNYGDDICRVFFDHKTYRIYITIDGTSSVLDFIRNLIFLKNKRTDCANAWYPAGEDLAKQINISIDTVSRIVGVKRYAAFILGKSRGGAIAPVVARELSKKYGFNVVECHSLGAPRQGGNKWFGQLWASDINFFNWVAKGDKVPSLPFKKLGFCENYGNPLEIPKYKGFVRTHLHAYRKYFQNMLRLGN